LGLTLGATLVRQLKSKLEIGRDVGTEFIITFSAQEPVRPLSADDDALPRAADAEVANGAALSEKDDDHVFSAHPHRRG
jgi:hypothetical protein